MTQRAPIFKYLPPERLDVLESGRIAFTPPGQFNDPFDMNPAMDWDVSDDALESQYAGFIRESPQSPLTLAEFKVNMRRHKEPLSKKFASERNKMINETFGVFCCTEHSDNMLMWAHYAKDHEGFVIEFDHSHPFFAGKMHKVEYAHERPLEGGQEDESWNGYVVKSKKWAEEKEWRMVAKLESCEKNQVMSNGSKKTIYLCAYPKEAVRRIICGLRMLPGNKMRLCQKLSEWSLGHSYVEELRLNPRIYEFDRFPICI